MSTIKTTIREFYVIRTMAQQLGYQTGSTIPVRAEYKTGGVQVTAPSAFLALLGF